MAVEQSPAVTVEYHGTIACVTLNRPRKKNAITKAMYKRIAGLMRALTSQDDVQVILLTGQGDYFTAGNDLSNFSTLQHPLSMAKEAREIFYEFIDSFICCTKPIIVAVNGPAIGIGVTLLGQCDKVYASTTATFRTPFAELGQTPEGCSSFLFPKIMGEATAEQVLGQGKLLSAQEALVTGLIHDVLPADQVLPAAMAHCEYLVSKSARAGERQRTIVKEGLVQKLQAVNAAEMDECEIAWISKESFGALAKYLESRKAWAPAMVLRTANALGFLWGQPSRNKKDRISKEEQQQINKSLALGAVAFLLLFVAIICALKNCSYLRLWHSLINLHDLR